jgi:hypothetical protein
VRGGLSVANDVAYPGPGTDAVSGGARNDIVFARDGRRDMIECGPGRDIAPFDASDCTRHREIASYSERSAARP